MVLDGDGNDYTAENLARRHTAPALKVLVSIMEDPAIPPGVRVRAASVVLDRGWGKPLLRVLESPESPYDKARREGTIFDSPVWREMASRIGLDQEDVV